MKKFKFQLHEDDRDSKLITIAKFDEFPTLEELNDAIKNNKKMLEIDKDDYIIFSQDNYDKFEFESICDYKTSDDSTWLFEINRI